MCFAKADRNWHGLQIRANKVYQRFFVSAKGPVSAVPITIGM
jgi:hypothetical protein